MPSKVSEDAEAINKTFKANQKLTKRVFRLQKELEEVQTMNRALEHLDEVEKEMKEGFEFFKNLILCTITTNNDFEINISKNSNPKIRCHS